MGFRWNCIFIENEIVANKITPDSMKEIQFQS